LALGTAPAAWAGDAGRPDHGLPLVVDGADVLTPEEEARLEDRLDQVSRERAEDVVVLTVESLDYRTATEFADDYFDYGPDPEDPAMPGRDRDAGYGWGPDRSGIILLVAVVSREWALSTRGDSIDAFTDARQARIMDQVRPLMSAGDWTGAFDEFADQAASVGQRDAHIPVGTILLVALIAAAIGGFVPVTIWKRQLKTVKPAVAAREHVDPASVVLAQSNDVLVSQHTSVIDTSSSSGGGGGSSTHFGSSGAMHGGSSGRF
jgi:uncharacterized protein